MAKFSLEIDTGNAAFDDEHKGAYEVSRILGYLAARMRERGWEVPQALHDVNGNKVGSWYYDGDSDDDSDAESAES